MLASELIEILSKDPNKEVYIKRPDVDTGFKYSPVDKVKIKSIGFQESPGGPILAAQNCILISSDY